MERAIEDYGQWLDYWAARQPEKIFLVSGERRITYGKMAEAAELYARKLRQISPRQVILIIRKNPEEQAAAFLGAEQAGWVPVLGHPDLQQGAARTLARKRKISWIDGEKLEKACLEAPVPERDVCMGVLSSGSTGLPKLMFRTYASWAGFFPEQNKMFQVNRDTVAFGEGSLSFTGNSNLWASVLYAGGSMVFGRGLHPRSWISDLKKYQVNVLYLVPVKLKLLLEACTDRFPSVKTVLAGSQMLDGETAKKLKNCFPSSEIILYYGASEVDYITWLTYEELLQHPLSVGRPCPGVGVKVRDDLIYIDTPYHVKGIARPCTLGDQGYFDKDGYLIFLGRKGQVVNKGGLTISCTRVEQSLLTVRGVRDCAVIPVRDEKRGEDLGACVVLDPDTSLSAVRRQLRQILLPGEIPGYWARAEALPLNGAGKIDPGRIAKILRS